MVGYKLFACRYACLHVPVCGCTNVCICACVFNYGCALIKIMSALKTAKKTIRALSLSVSLSIPFSLSLSLSHCLSLYGALFPSASTLWLAVCLFWSPCGLACEYISLGLCVAMSAWLRASDGMYVSTCVCVYSPTSRNAFVGLLTHPLEILLSSSMMDRSSIATAVKQNGPTLTGQQPLSLPMRFSHGRRLGADFGGGGKK